MNCENHFCDFKNATANEKLYLELATKNVCGSEKCILNENREFECNCPPRMEKKEDGLCQVSRYQLNQVLLQYLLKFLYFFLDKKTLPTKYEWL